MPGSSLSRMQSSNLRMDLVRWVNSHRAKEKFPMRAPSKDNELEETAVLSKKRRCVYTHHANLNK